MFARGNGISRGAVKRLNLTAQPHLHPYDVPVCDKVVRISEYCLVPIQMDKYIHILFGVMWCDVMPMDVQILLDNMYMRDLDGELQSY